MFTKFGLAFISKLMYTVRFKTVFTELRYFKKETGLRSFF